MPAKGSKADRQNMPYKDSGLAYRGSAIAFRSSDLTIKPEVIDRYSQLLRCRDSNYLANDLNDYQVIERRLTVLFGVIEAFKSQAHVGFFFSVVNRYWLEYEVSVQDTNRRTKDLVEAVLLARGHSSDYVTSSVRPAKTHLGRLIDIWAKHRHDNQHISFFKTPTPTSEDNEALKRIQRNVEWRIEKDPLTVFSEKEMCKETKKRIMLQRASATTSRAAAADTAHVHAKMDPPKQETQPSAIDLFEAYRKERSAERAEFWAEFRELGRKFCQMNQHDKEQMDKIMAAVKRQDS